MNRTVWKPEGLPGVEPFYAIHGDLVATVVYEDMLGTWNYCVSRLSTCKRVGKAGRGFPNKETAVTMAQVGLGLHDFSEEEQADLRLVTQALCGTSHKHMSMSLCYPFGGRRQGNAIWLFCEIKKSRIAPGLSPEVISAVLRLAGLKQGECP